MPYPIKFLFFSTKEGDLVRQMPFQQKIINCSLKSMYLLNRHLYAIEHNYFIQKISLQQPPITLHC